MATTTSRSRFPALGIILTVCVLATGTGLALLSVQQNQLTAKIHAAKTGTKPSGYYTCGSATWNDASCDSICTYVDPVYHMPVCANISGCKSCLQSTCNAQCTITNAKGKVKPAKCKVHITGQTSCWK